jgi:prepilin-type N-terminal cleavage/methylation domain-containing protein
LLLRKPFFILYGTERSISVPATINGFSLIELVVVIAVLAALTAIALPNFLRVQDDAKIAAAKQVLINISKECLAYRLKGRGPGTIDDIKEASGRLNPYGDAFGLSFGSDGFTFDTSINSNMPLRGYHSCEILAAKSGTFGDSNPVGQFPHFQIDIRSGTVKKDCVIDDSSQTFGLGHCDPSKPAGQQW